MLCIFRGLNALPNYYIPAILVVGHLVRSCTWAARTHGSGIITTCALQRFVAQLVDLARLSTAKMDYVHTICYTFVYNTQWHDDTPGAAHVEERCEALLAKFRVGCNHHTDKHMVAEAGGLFRTMPPRLASTCNGVPVRKCSSWGVGQGMGTYAWCRTGGASTCAAVLASNHCG